MRISRIETTSFLYVFLFLACLNVAEKGSVLFLVLTLSVIIYLKFQINFDKNTGILTFILFGISAVVSLAYFGVSEVIKCINYCGVYITATSAFSAAQDKKAMIKKSMFAIAAGFAGQIILVYLYNLYVGQPSTRTLYAIWNSGLISVTLIALLSAVVIGYSFYAIVCNKNRTLRVLAVVALMITFLINITTATRTPFALAVLVYFILFFLYTQNSSRKIKRKFWFCVVCMTVFGVFCFINDWFGARTFLLESALFERFLQEGMSTSRIGISMAYISKMFQYPFGGSFAQKELGVYAHNVLLEIYDMYGVIAFIIVLVFYVQSVKNIYIITKRGEDQAINFLLIGLYLAIMVQMFLEPVIEGYPIIFYVFLFIHGISNCYIKYSKEREKNYENNRNQYM